MSERSEGYQAGIADAASACTMLATSILKDAQALSGSKREVAEITAQALALASKAISDLEPGFMSPSPDTDGRTG